MRTTGLGFSIFLVALGAILAWAVTIDIAGMDLNMIGVILFAVGVVGAIATIALGAAAQRTVVERDREIVVEHDPSTIR